jgi:hypothetical protein
LPVLGFTGRRESILDLGHKAVASLKDASGAFLSSFSTSHYAVYSTFMELDFRSLSAV